MDKKQRPKGHSHHMFMTKFYSKFHLMYHYSTHFADFISCCPRTLTTLSVVVKKNLGESCTNSN